jgi:YVTN family beta-propeller protein
MTPASPAALLRARWLTRTALATLLLLTAACGDSEPPSIPTPDAGGLPDGGSPPDGGVPDAGGLATYALLAGNTATGFVDGPGTAARFSGPAGATLSPDGTSVYVADTFNNLLRRIDTSTGAVSTLVGQVQQAAAVDGTGTAARLKNPRALTLAPDGSALYLADGPSLRRVTLPGLEVTTLAGNADVAGYEDLVGDAARLGFLIHSLAISEDGQTLYLADRSNRVLRTLHLGTLQVSTVAGTRYTGSTYLNQDGIGAAARFSGLGGIVRVGGVLYVADTFNHTVRRVDLTSWQVDTVAGAAGQADIVDGAGAVARFNTPQSLTSDGTFLYMTGWDGLLRRVALADFDTKTVLGVKDELRPVDGTGAQVRLGIAFGPPLMDAARGLLYYNDRDASSLRRLRLDTLEMTTLAGSQEPRGSRDGPGLNARFSGPSAIVYSARQQAYFVTDSSNQTVRRIHAATGEVSTVAGRAGVKGGDDGGPESATFLRPYGLALDDAGGKLYVSDGDAHTIRVVELAGRTVSTLAGTPEQAGTADGTAAAARFTGPRHLALSPDGRTLYVADSGSGTLRVVDTSSGEVSTLAGTAGQKAHLDGVGAEARFRTPLGLALDAASGRLYVSDSAGHTLRAVDVATRQVSTLAGTDRASGVADGPLAEAFFKGPGGLALDASGASLYVADTSNHVVRRVDLKAGSVSTWLGRSTRAGGIAPGTQLPLSVASLYFPAAVALGAGSVAIVTEDAIGVARPVEMP